MHRNLNELATARLHQSGAQPRRKLEHGEAVILHRHHITRVCSHTPCQQDLPVRHPIAGVETRARERGSPVPAPPRPDLSSHLITRYHEELDSDGHDPIMPAHPQG